MGSRLRGNDEPSTYFATIAAIHARLATIPEPCSLAMGRPTTITGMGLVEAVALTDDGAVTVTLCLTDAACVHFRGMQAFIRDELLAIKGITSVDVRQTLDMLWTPDRVRA